MFATTLLISLLTPNLDNLSHPSWHHRERWTHFYSNKLSATLLPKASSCPEANARLQRIHRVAFAHQCPKRQELCLRLYNPRQWLHNNVVFGDSLVYTDDEIYLQLRADSGLADMFFEVAPSVNGQRYWLYGTIIPTEYEQYREHLHYHRHAGVVQPAIAVTKGTK